MYSASTILLIKCLKKDVFVIFLVCNLVFVTDTETEADTEIASFQLSHKRNLINSIDYGLSFFFCRIFVLISSSAQVSQ